MSVMKHSLKHTALGLLAAAFTLAAAVPARAADDPANVIKYRQNVMKSQAGHIGAIAAVVKGEVSYTRHIAAHARALERTSAMIPDMFPEGTGVGDTRAKPDIWQNWAKFEVAAKALGTASGELARVAESGDMAAVGAQLQEVGKACGGCHKPFRKKKE